MTLYEMTQQAALLYELLQAEEIDEQTVADTIESMDTETKLESYCKLIRQFEADEMNIQVEIDRLTAAKKRAKSAQDRLKYGVIAYMQTLGKEKENAGTFVARLTHGKSLRVLDEKLIPKKFFVMKPQLDKTAVKNAIADGKKVKGAEIEITTGLSVK